ncbi:MAG: anti-sigma factor [Bacteroidota bacterium]
MEVQEYISSGILEAYIMGELSEEEMQKVDEVAMKYPEIQIEIEKIRASIHNYAKASGNLPSEEILDGVFDQPVKRETEAVFNEPSKVPFWAVAASVLLLVSIGFNIYFASELNQSQKELDDLIIEKSAIAQQVETTSQKLEYANLRIAHFLNKDNIHVRMEGLPLSPDSYANVFWNKKSNAVFISVDNLPAPPHGHQYQLWAIKDGQPPIDAGIFDHNNLVQELKIIQGDVLAFAVTLEKEGGTPYATVEKTYVKGVLEKS